MIDNEFANHLTDSELSVNQSGFDESSKKLENGINVK
jgi:hypothetical protein